MVIIVVIMFFAGVVGEAVHLSLSFKTIKKKLTVSFARNLKKNSMEIVKHIQPIFSLGILTVEK